MSTLDRASGYWQIVTRPENREKNCLYHQVWPFWAHSYEFWSMQRTQHFPKGC
jgi:hypothetical protein